MRKKHGINKVRKDAKKEIGRRRGFAHWDAT
jgi:hypothetical protein